MSIGILLHLPIVQKNLLSQALRHIEKTTHYHITCKKIRLTWFQYISFTDIRVTDPQARPLLALDQCKSIIHIWSLLFLKPNIIDSLEVNGIQLYLEEDREHAWNINTFYKKVILPLIPKTETDLAIRKIRINKGNFHLYRQIAQQHFTIKQLQLHIDHLLSTRNCHTGSIASFCYQESDLPILCKNFSVQYAITPHRITFKDCQLITLHSNIHSNLQIENEGPLPLWENWTTIIGKASFHDTILSSTELNLFWRIFKPTDNDYKLDGHISLTPYEIRWENCKLAFGKSYIESRGSYDRTNKQTHINCSTNEHFLYLSDLPFYVQQNIKQYDYLSYLQHIKLSSFLFTGNRHKAKMAGNISTNIGNIQPDLIINQLGDIKNITYDGNIILDQLALDHILPTLPITSLSANIALKGKGWIGSQPELDIITTIHTMATPTYIFNGIKASGKLLHTTVNFDLCSDQPDVKLTMAGSYNWRDHINMHGIIEQINLEKLGYTTLPLIMGTKFSLNLHGITTATPLGELFLDNFSMQSTKKKINGNQITIHSTQQGSKQVVMISSPWITGNIEGSFTLTGLQRHLQYLWQRLLHPVLIKDKGPISNNNSLANESFMLDYTICCKNIIPLLRWFSNDWYLSPTTTIYGHLNYDKDYYGSLYLPIAEKICGKQFSLEKATIKTVVSHITDPNKQLITLNISSERQNWSQAYQTDHLLLQLLVNNNKFTLTNQLSATKYDSTLSLTCNGTIDKNRIQVTLQPSTLTTKDKVWTMQTTTSSSFTKTSISIGNLSIQSGDESIAINGQLSKFQHNNALHCIIRKVALDHYIKKIGGSCIGILDANLTACFLNDHFVTTGEISLQQCKVKDYLLGALTTTMHWNTSNNKLVVGGVLCKGTKNICQIDGTYDPEKPKNRFNVTLLFDQMDLLPLNFIVEPICSVFKGKLSGRFQLEGSFYAPRLNGQGRIDKGNFKINYLNTVYTATGSVTIHENVLTIDQFYLHDSQNGHATLSGSLTLQQGWPFRVSGKMKELHLLHTNRSPNAEFYGTLYATGEVKIQGTIDDVVINMHTKADKGTFTMVTHNKENLEHPMQLVHFIYPHKDKIFNKPITNKKDETPSIIKFILDVSIQPTVTIEVLLGAYTTNDRIQGNGMGSIHLEVGTNQRPYLMGNYIFQTGTFTISVYNVIQKIFTIQSNSRVTFNGYPQDGIAQINAFYIQTTSINGPDTNGSYKRRSYQSIPVEISLAASGILASPQITYGISFPVQHMDLELNAALEKCNNRALLDKHYLGKQILNLLITKMININEDDKIDGMNAINASINDLIVQQAQHIVSALSPNLALEAIGIHPFHFGNQTMDTSYQPKVTVSYLFWRQLKLTTTLGRYSRLINDWEIAYQFLNFPHLVIKLYQQLWEKSSASRDKLFGIGFSYIKKFQ